ncbi:AmmeMemoRadiSam system protein B [bacterium]|nr:AmmeMemoRadiSam system protein B [bacterium]
MSAVRSPVLSGTWYPDDPARLRREVDAFLADAVAADRPRGRPLIAVVPHAGYLYSGATAGRLYGLLRDAAPRRVVILAPNHRVPLRRLALSGAAAYATPLGEVAVDTAAVDRLAASPAFAVDDSAHAEEHAVEIQLPLLQRTWPEAVPRIVPVLVPRLEPAVVRAAAAALGEVLDAGTLLLVSTDLTHYGRSFGYVPFTDDVPAALEQLDAGAILKVLAGDPAGLRAFGERTGITMCGLEAAALALETGLPAGYEGALLDYRRSGDRDGDYSVSVSYAAVLLCSGEPADAAGRAP